jgi:hypothetical protein
MVCCTLSELYYRTINIVSLDDLRHRALDLRGGDTSPLRDPRAARRRCLTAVPAKKREVKSRKGGLKFHKRLMQYVPAI